ncbi:hypothetical protein, partial [Endozoicomonas sp. SESOKO3]|uniref:hypothetical protein n=1 Tax=Endozoicomonas sp. SESOKO3 TaxID=2828744 RepID=UPI00214997F8
MTQARPNAVSLAVAIAIYSSIIGTQALADRRLQTKSFDIPGNEGVEFTQTEVVVQPTLGDDQQPIPKSFTTTYPDQTEARAVYDVPSEGFTDVLSGIDGGVSSVDLFETGKNDVAQKYTKVLRVGNEGVFRFTHNLAEKQLVIEVRDGMTCQNSIRAVRIQSVNTRLLEPLTKVASPKQLARILKGANGRAGSLGAADKYTALATIKIDEVEVAGRTFMRLVASGDQPPEPQRLGKSLFINDETLLAAATSAYTQVYVLGKSLQQEALNELLAYQKPVGYVVHVEDETLAYYVPDGYPRLEVVQAPGEEIEEIIVFHGQKQNPTDIAFVKSLFNLRAEVVGNAPAPAVTAQVKKDKLKSYQHIIRSRQMALLEELAIDFAVQFDAEFEEGKLLALARYEALQQALTSATPDNENEFEFTAAHIKVASSIMTAIWLQIQLEKHFNFKPVLRDLLASEAFVQSVQRVIPAIAELPANGFGDDVKLATKVFGDMTRQLLELENQQEGLNARAGELAQLKNFLQHATERANAIEAEKQRAQSLRKQIEEELEMLLQEWKDTKKWRDKLQQEADRIPELEQQASDARVKATKIRNAQMAAELGIDDWDDFQPPEVQKRLITERINEINRAVASTVAIAGEFEEKAVKAKLAAIEGHLDIIPGNEDDLDARFESIHHHLQQQAGQNIELAAQRLAIVADLLGLVPDNKNDLQARHQNIQHQQHLMQQVDQEPLQSTETYAEELTAIKARHADIAEQLNIENFDGNADIFLQQERLLRKLQTISDHQKHLLQKLQTLNVQDAEGEAILKARQNALASMLGIEMSKDWTVEYRSTLIDVACRKIRKLEKVLKDIRTPGHTRAWPEVLLKISAVEKAAGIEGLHKEQDIYVRRQAISDEMQTHIEEIAKQAEEEALQILEAMETILNLKVKVKVRVYKDDDKAARLSNIRLKLDSDDIPEDVLDQLLTALWEEDRTLLDRTLLAERAIKFQRLRARLSYSVEGSKERARDQQRQWLEAIEEKLNIKTSENAFAKPRGHLLVFILADDLGVELEMDDSLHNKKDAIRAKIFDLLDEVDEAYDDEAVRRDRNNALARQLNIKDYKDDATIDEQNRLIEYRLYQLDVSVRKIGEPDVSERIRAIDNELDELMAPLGPKPRYVLDRELATARREVEEAVDELTGAYRLLATLEGKNVKFAGNRADIQHLSDRGNKALNRDMKKVQIHLGLAADDDQTSEGRIEDIRLLLKKKSAEKRDEILENLRAKTNLNIEITSGLSLLEDSDYFITISSCTDSHGQKEALGRLPLTRKKYTQVTEFLREHDRKSIELANARLEEWDAKEKLDRQEKEIIDPGYMDQNAKPMHEDEMAWLGLVLKQKSDAVLKAEVALTDYHKAVLEATEASVGLKSDTSDTHEQRINALRNKQVQLGGDDGTGG